MPTNDLEIPSQPDEGGVTTLEELLAGVTDVNVHPEIDASEPVGEEWSFHDRLDH
ncbi:MAG: hypothetical protein PVJ21_15220 [Anaerolineales bacterium]|jgi:hypothetical protein